MSRVINFSAGPAALPLEVLEQAKADLPDWAGTGMSVMELSHRSKIFIALAEESEANLRELMQIPDDYAVLFLQGGATLQFAQVPMNLSRPGDYLLPLVVAIPFATGFLAMHPAWNPEQPGRDTWRSPNRGKYLRYRNEFGVFLKNEFIRFLNNSRFKNIDVNAKWCDNLYLIRISSCFLS